MGSLFKVRDYWTKNHAEEYDARSMVCDNIDNDPSGMSKIIVGSFQGWLRMYTPHQKGFEPHDVLLEKDFKMPILQIAAGNFLPTASQRSLAVLCPLKLYIVEIKSVGTGQVSIDEENINPLARAYTIRTVADFTRDRTSYNMVCGTFGRSDRTGQDYICVQSMDGEVAFYDHNKLLFRRFIPSADFLIPGHLLYVPGKDMFLTNSSTNMLHCYRYSTFANAAESSSKDEEREGKKIVPEWSFNLGEDVMDLCQCRVTRGLAGGSNVTEFAVLCERTLFVLKEDGGLRFNRRLDSPGSSITAYTLPDGKTDNLIVGTHSKAVMIYSDKQLLWSASTNAVPLRVAVAGFVGIQGLLVILTDDGVLSANYLGTDPASNPIQLLESKDLDYDAMDAEHRKLQGLIKKATTTGVKSEPKDLLMTEIHGTTHQHGTRTAMAVLAMQYTGGSDISGIVITIVASESLVPDQKSTVIDSLPAGESLSIPISFTLGGTAETDHPVSLLPTSLLIEIFITYTVANGGDTLTAKTQFLAPLSLVGGVVPVIKTGAFKVQIDTNKDPPQLSELFPEFAEHPDLTPNIISFQYCEGGDASILVSKNGGRYRVQASTFEGIWLLTSELVRRLKTHFKRDSTPLRIDYNDPLPTEEYFALVDAHFNARETLTKANEALSTVATQFRAIQKRLLVKFREKTPMPLTSFEALFEGTYRQLYAAAETVSKSQEALSKACDRLSCATHLLLLLIRYKHQDTFSNEDFDTFKNCLSPNVSPLCTASGWEETVDAMLAYLLRTTLSKSSTARAGADAAGASAQPLAVTNDTAKLKKHIALVLDRIAKGGTVADRSAATGGKDSVRSPRGTATKRTAAAGGAPSNGGSTSASVSSRPSTTARKEKDVPIEILESKRGRPPASSSSSNDVAMGSSSGAVPVKMSPTSPQSPVSPQSPAAAATE